MTPRRPSRTAVLVAVARALHREEPPPWVLDDPLAMRLAGEEAPEVARRLKFDLTPEALLGFTRWICVRARLAEDTVETAMKDGLQQYVILGAGLDSFAYRRTDLLRNLRVLEIDQPASQAWKRQRLDEMIIVPPDNLIYAPIDFESQTLTEGLIAAGFDFTAPTVFSWMGVTLYLSVEAIRSSLATVASCASGTKIVLTYNLPPSSLQEMGRETDSAIRRFANDSDEPILTMFEPPEIADLMLDMGFSQIVDFGPDDAIRTYFPGRSDVRFGGAQRLIVATVG